MRQEIRLYVGDREVEFSQPPAIYYNYTETDLKNPTTIKNSFSKSITIEGTPTNNDIFGHYWDLERFQQFGSSSGPSYNAMQKVDFKLFVNGNLYERGYCRLDSVQRNGRTIVYQITLFGGLGSFMANLSWGDGEDNSKKTLADLVYRPYGDLDAAPLDLDFTINKETVNTAWNQLERTTDQNKKWDVINFAVCAEGVPEDFEASKVLINMNPMGSEMVRSEDGYAGLAGTGITPTGYALGETRIDLTSDMAMDLRSYLLRPVVSVRSIFDAIKLPENNGGYEVQLDNHFFNQDNPYYYDAWVTLSKLRDLGIERVNSISPTPTLSKQSYNWYNINYTNTLAKQNNFVFGMNLVITGIGTTSATELWQCSKVKTNAEYHNRDEYVKEFEVNQSVFLKVVAYDSNGIEVGSSKEIWCISETQGAISPDYQAKMGVDVYYGHFYKQNGKWIFCDRAGNPYKLEFTLPSSLEFSSIKLFFKTPSHYQYRLTKGWPVDKKDTVNNTEDQNTPYAFYTAPEDLTWNGLHTMDEAFAHNRVQGYYAFSSLTLTVSMDDFDGFFSGTRITKSKLLHTSYSVADFLLSYCKLFNLYFYKDPVEDSDEPLTFPNGVVHIVDRNTFYTGEYVNVEDDIDRSKTININPTLAATKWYNLSYQEGNGEAESTYKNKFGYTYGRQLLNTGLAFNSETTDIYEGNVFKNGVQVQEKCGYYMQPYYGVPVYLYDGMTYQLFKVNEGDGDQYDGKEFQYPIKKMYTGDLNTQGLKYYDVMPKLQIHSEDNKSEDGSGILLFFNTFISTQYFNNITDDLPEMGTLCDGNPCWLMTPNAVDGAGNTIAIQRLNIPMFTRDLYENGVSGKIIHTWNFGHPQMTYVPYAFTTDFDCLYDKFFKDYLSDLYDVSTKGVSCYVRLKGKPNPAMLRKWYWFDNAIWRINKITDWNIGSYDPTLVEFIKIQDVDNYALERISRQGRIQIVLNSYNLTNIAQTLTGRVICQNPSEHWYIQVVQWEDTAGNSQYLDSSAWTPSQGTGTTNISISVPANSGAQRTYDIMVRDSDDHTLHFYFTQAGSASIDFAPESKNVEVGVNAQTYVLHYVATNIRPGSVYATSNSTEWVDVVSVDEATNSITLSVSASSMGGMRTALITVGAIGLNSAVVNNQTQFRQQGSDIDIDFDRVDFDYNSTGTNRVHIITSSEWTATINDSNGQ